METNGKSFAPVPGKIPGTRVNLGGQDYILAPLNLFQVETLHEQILQLNAPSDNMRENIERSLPLILASLQRNYPDITLDELRNLIDLGNFAACTRAVVEISGYAPAQSGE